MEHKIVPAEAEAEADRSRVAIRLTVEHLLRSIQLLVSHTNNDLLTSIIFAAIGQANVAHLMGPDDDYAGLAVIPPDEVRRPVSVLAIAQSLRLPYETTRRHVEKMVRSGACRRVKGGVIVPAAILDTPANRDLVRANMTNLRRLFRALKAAGVDLS